MSPLGEDKLAAIRERLNNGQPITLEDSRFLLLSVDRWQSMVRERIQQVERLKDRLRELQWANRSDDGKGYCPVCDKAQDAIDGHTPTCWLWLLIRTA